MSPMPQNLETIAAEEVETLIFLDIDGVLNVGIRDPGSRPLSFNDANISVARKLEECKACNETSEILLAVMRAETCDGNTSTYAEFVSRRDIDICDVFVDRLTQILQAAGSMRRVIICSSWRRPKYAALVEKLENIVSASLDEDFKFDDRTSLKDENGGADRLLLIGEYISSHCNGKHKDRMRVLVLDDFFYQPIRGYNCGGMRVDSLASAESYLRDRHHTIELLRVKIVQTYTECLLPSGMHAQIGSGLSLQHLNDALSFLNESGNASFDTAPEIVVDTADVKLHARLQPANPCCHLM
eukprot:TRINITY_DN34213_c0_g1_i2.p1 TRINITY_DN34213_c0_g1~~TRINITY_DN34213_c0_g1_i2.p1  ORF type:complete len:309 (+),score=39.89 TRINITY_DN34213_c0_g1_i2:33-929(+)